MTTYSALTKFSAVIKDELVLIIGAGGPGLMCVTILKAMGGCGAVVVDIDEKRRDAALAAGAVAVIDGAAPDALAQVSAALGGPCWAAVDLVGSPQTAALGFDALGKGGKLVMIGLFGGSSAWPLPFIPMKAASIIGSYTGNLAETRELLDLVRSGKIPRIPMQTRPLREATETLEDLKAGRIIHYDKPFAVFVERHQGLVVPGEFVSASLLDLVREKTSGARIASVNLRVLRWLYDIAPVRLCARRVSPREISVWAEDEKGDVAIEGLVRIHDCETIRI